MCVWVSDFSLPFLLMVVLLFVVVCAQGRRPKSYGTGKACCRGITRQLEQEKTDSIR